MKTFHSRIVCIAFIVCNVLISRAQMKDDFSDGNFTKNPSWTGDTSHFEINPSGQLHLKSSGSDTSVLFTRNPGTNNMEWNFWVKLSFNTSSGNNARIYLTADTSSIRSITNAIYIQAGGGDDSVFIVKQTGAYIKTMYRFKSYKTFHSTNTLRIRVTREDPGQWTAMIDTIGGYSYAPDGTFYDDSFQPSAWFGLFCRYTSSNATKFYFDDFYAGPVLRDTIPPRIIYQEMATSKVLRIGFSEPIREECAGNPENFRLISDGSLPDSVTGDIYQPGMISIFLHNPLADGSFDSVSIRNLRDLSGNPMPDTTIQICYYIPKTHDVLIHEIMPDPDPQVGLPDGEFVELYNRSDFPINFQGWRFTYGSSTKVFPSITLRPGGYLLIAGDSAYLNFGNCAVLFTSSSSLSNEGTDLVLRDKQNHIIHAVSYSPGWYRDTFKEEGGWSLEMMDPLNPCGCSDNWAPSEDPAGGTPGRPNSTAGPNPDETPPVAGRAIIADSVKILVYFSEAMDSISLTDAPSWKISPFENHPDGVCHPLRVIPAAPDFSSCELRFSEKFEKGITYLLHVSGNLKDCAGNPCDTMHSIRFAIPGMPAASDLVINEVLSDPFIGGARFAELYNRSENIIDLQSLVLAAGDTSGGILVSARPLTATGYLLFPGEYAALTPSREDICNRYRRAIPDAIVTMNGFPVLGDDSGTIIIARKDDFGIIDRMHYIPGMHYPLLATTEGVSLERTSPDMDSDDPGNWHSAAETAGFATPGCQNSHWKAWEETNLEIMLQPEIFSPDNDGYDDLLTISIRENEPDFAVNIVVYDSRGRFVRQIANNVLIGSEGLFIWDGMSASGGKVSLGFYVLLIELIRPDGTARKIKRTVIVGGKL